MDSNVAKEPQGRDGGKARGGLPKHMQGHHGSSSKSDPKLPSPSPGEIYHTSYSPAPGRSQHLLPPQLDNPSGRDESSTSSKEKTQNKQMSMQDLDDGSFGKTTMTATKFINFKDHQGCALENYFSKCQKCYQTGLNKFSCVS